MRELKLVPGDLGLDDSELELEALGGMEGLEGLELILRHRRTTTCRSAHHRRLDRSVTKLKSRTFQNKKNHRYPIGLRDGTMPVSGRRP